MLLDATKRFRIEIEESAGEIPQLETSRVMSANSSPKLSNFQIFLIVLVIAAVLVALAGLMLPGLAKAKGRAQRISGQLAHLYPDIAASARMASGPFNTESYDRIVDNPFLDVMHDPLSTFSIDVDTASYANVRRFLARGTLPPQDAVRIEELLNYFSYDYPAPIDEHPFAAHVEIGECPWKPEHRLARVGLKGKEIAVAERPACNLVFLVDVSGSMQDPNKLPLVIAALELLVQQLTAKDRIAMVVYAGSAGVVLDGASGADKARILGALRRLQAGGSTHGSQGIERAYKIAAASFIAGGANRVILCTDGDFNVGVTSVGDLTRLIEDKAKTGVFLRCWVSAWEIIRMGRWKNWPIWETATTDISTHWRRRRNSSSNR